MDTVDDAFINQHSGSAPSGSAFRADFNSIPKLTKNIQICELQSGLQVLDIQVFIAIIQDLCALYNGTRNDRAKTYALINAFLKHDKFKTTVTGQKIVQLIIISSSGGSPLCNYSTALFKKVSPEPESDVFAVAYALERLGLSESERAPLPGAVDASPNVSGSNIQREFEAFLDSGASTHVTGDKTTLSGYEPLSQPWQIAVADGYLLDVFGIGSITTPGGCFTIHNVLYVQGLNRNLISVGQLDRDHGLFCGFHGGTCEIMKRDGEVIGGGILQPNGLYKLRFLQVPEN